MSKRSRRQTGYAGRPLALRRELLAILGRVDKLSVRELAAAAYSGRVCRSRPPSCSAAQITATRKAIRRLIDRGHVVAVGVYRRRQLFALAGRDDPPLLLELEPLSG
ncbi:hypothetical protein ACVIGA_000909 [Bradyrhizobium sp. USDA 3240]